MTFYDDSLWNYYCIALHLRIIVTRKKSNKSQINEVTEPDCMSQAYGRKQVCPSS